MALLFSTLAGAAITPAPIKVLIRTGSSIHLITNGERLWRILYLQLGHSDHTMNHPGF